MNYIIWNKIDKINNIEAKYFIDSLRIKETDGVFLIGSDLNNVQSIEIDRIIKNNHNLDSNLTTEQVAQEYLKIKEEEKLQAEKKQITLEKQGDKISILEAENADLLLDSAIKDMKLKSIEKDLADLTLEVVMGGM